MKYAILADIHANLPALQAVLADAEAQRCEQLVCLGDVVGYYNYPKECVELMRNNRIPCVKGNHDEYCSDGRELTAFNACAARSVEWTRTQLERDEREWLGNLDAVKVVDGFTLVHATLDNPQRWGYVFSKMDAAASFRHQTTPVCFFGHTHMPVAFIEESHAIRGGTYSKIKIDAKNKYFVNPGSVGQPRDNNPKAAYVVYDAGRGIIELRRLDYDRSQVDGGGGDAPAPVVPLPRPPVSGRGHQQENLN